MTLERITKWLAITLGIAFIAVVLTLSIMRLMYPYEIEWMEGAMLDHVVRILDGKPIYSAPTIDFIPWLYPPLYYYAVALVAKIVGLGFFAGRIVSFISTLITAVLMGWMVQRITKNRLFSFLNHRALLCNVPCDGLLFRHRAQRCVLYGHHGCSCIFADAVMREQIGAIATALLFVFAFLTRQQAVFFLLPLVVWFWLRDKKLGISLYYNCDRSYAHCAFRDLCSHARMVHILHVHDPKREARGFFHHPHVRCVPKLCAGTICRFNGCVGTTPPPKEGGASIVGDARGWSRIFSSDTGLLIMMALAALAAGAMSLGNEGGDRNVMMPFAAFVLPLLPIALNEIKHAKPAFARYVYLAFLFQFVALYFNPLSGKMVIASAKQRAGGDEFMRKLRAMPGEVYIPYHGYITRQAGKPSHAQLLATIDVLRVHDTTSARLQADFNSAFARHRFSAVIMEESDAFRLDSVAHYTLCRAHDRRAEHLSHPLRRCRHQTGICVCAEMIFKNEWIYFPLFLLLIRV